MRGRSSRTGACEHARSGVWSCVEFTQLAKRLGQIVSPRLYFRHDTIRPGICASDRPSGSRSRVLPGRTGLADGGYPGPHGKYRPRVGLEDAPEPSSPVSVSDPMLSATLRRLIQTLPDRPRMVVILRYQEDMEPAEIAQAMEIPIGTVKSILHRALSLLRGKMEREQKGARK